MISLCWNRGGRGFSSLIDWPVRGVCFRIYVLENERLEPENHLLWTAKTSSMTLGSTSSFFQVTLWSPKWRSLNPWKGHLTHPKRSFGRTWILIFRGLFFVSTGHWWWSRFVPSPPWNFGPVNRSQSKIATSTSSTSAAQFGVLCCFFCRWWCQIFFIFTPTWERFPFWLDIFC